MTDTTREIFEKYQVRKNKRRHDAFIGYVDRIAREWDYPCRVEKGSLGARNIVIGDPDSAKVVYTAHYDTCPVLPFPNFITPKCISLYILYQFAIVIGFLAVAVVLGALFGAVSAILGLSGGFAVVGAELVYIFLLFLLLAGPANKHTANDNTSGVTLLLDIMRELPTERRGEVAFIFFDLEELGLIGSSSFARKHKAEMKDRLLINFDCVSDGENMLFVLRRGAARYREAIEQAFAERDGFRVELAERGVFYPSDQISFPCGVGVAALRSTKGGMLYMNRIHTRRDVIYREENIEFLKDGAIRLPELM